MGLPLLLTSSVVAHDVAVKLSDTEARLHLTLESIAQWLRIDPDLPIVLCDGSNFDLSDQVREHFPTAMIECLAFQNDQRMVKELGRGWGEGEIVKYAIAHSRMIRSSGCFAKCTSKLWVENYKEVLQHWNKDMLFSGIFDSVFSLRRPTTFKSLDTRFYAISVAAYEEYFINAHITMNSRAGHGLEDSFYDNFVNHKLSHGLSPIYPVISGVGGGTGKYYKNRKVRVFKELIRLTIARNSLNFKNLFCN
jgi:hypothetical protein